MTHQNESCIVEEESAIASVKLVKLQRIINASTWSNELEELLKSWGEKAAGNTELHSTASRYWKKIGDRLFTPVLVLNTLCGVINFGAANTDSPEYWMYSVGVLNLFAAMLGGVSQYYKPIEESEKHFHTSRTFGSFYRCITVELGIGREYRKTSGELIKWATTEYDRILADCPLIPMSIIENYKKTHTGNNLPDCVSDMHIILVNRK
jgi:hypothetical protein